MFVPQLANNILSVDALDEKGYSTLFANGIGKVFDRSTRKIMPGTQLFKFEPDNENTTNL